MQATSTVSLCYIHGVNVGEVKIPLAAQPAALNNISLRASLITLYQLLTSEYPTLKVHAEF